MTRGTTEGLNVLILCAACGKTMAENSARCHDCGTTVTCLIRDEGDDGEVVSATNTSSGPITAEETTTFLMQKAPLPTYIVTSKFIVEPHIRNLEAKKAFARILRKRISEIRKTTFGEEDADGEVIDADGGVTPGTPTMQKETKEEPVDNIV